MKIHRTFVPVISNEAGNVTIIKMKAIVYFTDGSKSLVHVNSSYSRGGNHFYDLTLNTLNTFLDYSFGIRKTFTGEEVQSLTYVMS